MIYEFELNEKAYKQIKEFHAGKRPYVFFKEQKTGTFFLYTHGTKDGLLGIGNNGYNAKLFIERALEKLDELRVAIIESNRPLGIIACHCGLIGSFDVNGIHVIPISNTHEEIQAYAGETIDDGYILEIFTEEIQEKAI